MSKPMSLIETLVAIELGCEFEWQDKAGEGWYVDPRQNVETAIMLAGHGREIRPTPKPWDFAIEGRKNVDTRVWLRYVDTEDYHDRWFLGFILGDTVYSTDEDDSSACGLYGIETELYLVVPDPRYPDQPPSDDWSPEGKRVIV